MTGQPTAAREDRNVRECLEVSGRQKEFYKVNKRVASVKINSISRNFIFKPQFERIKVYLSSQPFFFFNEGSFGAERRLEKEKVGGKPGNRLSLTLSDLGAAPP